MDLSTIHLWLRTIHIAAGFLGLAAFWLPLLVRKGGKAHVFCGRAYVGCAMVIIATALAACIGRLADPFGAFGPRQGGDEEEFANRTRLFAAFLGALAVYTLVPIVLAVRIVRQRDTPRAPAGSLLRILLPAELGVSLALIWYAATLWMTKPGRGLGMLVAIIGVFGLGTAMQHIRAVRCPVAEPLAWRVKHTEYMLTKGIGFHTAFAVFGLKGWLGELGSGPLALVPWVLPATLGYPMLWWYVKKQATSRFEPNGFQYPR